MKIEFFKETSLTLLLFTTSSETFCGLPHLKQLDLRGNPLITFALYPSISEECGRTTEIVRRPRRESDELRRVNTCFPDCDCFHEGDNGFLMNCSDKHLKSFPAKRFFQEMNNEDLKRVFALISVEMT